MRIAGTVLAILLLAAGAMEAREYAPRVVSPHRADAYSMRTFRRFPPWRDLEGDALAWEAYTYLVNTRSGVFHVNEVLEGHDVLREYQVVRDPVKIINVYGYGFCGLFGPVMEGVWKDMGAGPARTLALPDWSHMTSEVFYDGGWHYVDLDVRAVFRRDDGTLASIADARRDPSLWNGRGPLFFPNDPLEKTRQVYLKTAVQHYYGFNQSGHTMDYVLRQGETFTRWWTPQGGRWHHRPEWNRLDWLRRLVEQEPRGPKPNHRHFTIHNYANGRFVYRPDLAAGSSDFRDGAWDARNVRPAEGGLTLAAPGEGFAVFEVRSPYVIVPVVGDLDTTDDDREASVVRADGRGLALALSLDGGRTWRDLAADALPAALDLTPHVAGTYGYLLKVTLRGRPGETVLRSLDVTTWVQVAPAALPVLRRGTNRMAYRTGDHYGLKTRLVEVRSDASRPEELLKYCAEPPADYDPSRKTARIRGPVLVQVEAPPGAKIAWFSAQGSFRTHQGEAARNTHNTMAWAADEPEEFREIYRADMPADVEHWHTNVCREVRLDRPAARVFVRYVGDPALNNVHIYAHCLDDGRPSARPVAITHTWREGGDRRHRTVTLKEPGPYQIAVRGEPVCESVEIAVPSDAP